MHSLLQSLSHANMIMVTGQNVVSQFAD